MKICLCCDKSKPISEFVKTMLGFNRHKYNNVCSICFNHLLESKPKQILSIENEHRIKQCNRDTFLKHTYGIRLADYLQLLKNQDNCCAICKSKSSGGKKKYFSVDHNHQTGKVRGLLCCHCNTLLGGCQR